ncbi:hypothetical protein PN36_28130 [Candidatus Thiomargarita nelsonii]|uniref:Inactive STAND domain-containing protein n=1 Tax=Candidatus Thiomargarita nelsonii TaxID=1003181 RepID=A0A0A6P2Z5_9GAMM|nr:hypothetical protein PN36_28130 [Candidatus Thiomargarita nelsonii]
MIFRRGNPLWLPLTKVALSLKMPLPSNCYVMKGFIIQKLDNRVVGIIRYAPPEFGERILVATPINVTVTRFSHHLHTSVKIKVINEVVPQPDNSLLSYLPNRKSQKDKLRDTIKAYQEQYSDKRQRPLLCLIHGDTSEYGNFIKCLLKDFLPNDNYLSEYFCNGLFEIELLLEEFHTVDELHQEILDFLENKVNAAAQKDAIANKLARERRPIVIHARMLTKDLEDWQDDEKTVIVFQWKN